MKIVIDIPDRGELQVAFLVEQFSRILISSAKAGYRQITEQMLAQHSYPANVVNEAMIAAARGGHIDIAESMCQHGANVHYGCDLVLKDATKACMCRVINWVLSHGVSDDAKQDALLIAIENSYLSAVESLAVAGASLGNKRREVLTHVRNHWHWQILQVMHQNGTVMDDLLDELLLTACQMDNTHMIKWLYQIGADISPDYQSPILTACRNDSLSAVKWLAFHGVDIRANDDKCLDTALCNNNHNVARWLCFQGAPIDAQINFDCEERTYRLTGAHLDYPDDRSQLVDWLLINDLGSEMNPLIISNVRKACRRGNLERVEWLLQHGVKLALLLDPNMFECVCSRGDRIMAEWLLSKGVVPNLRSAFMHAAIKGHLSILVWLKSAYPDYAIPAADILDWACEREPFYPQVADWLIEQGADTTRDNYGILVQACRDRRTEALDWLFQQPEIVMNVFDLTDTSSEVVRAEITERARAKKAKSATSAAIQKCV